MSKSDWGLLVVFILLALFFLGGLVMVIMAPKFEADAFNDCTGGNATYMTALFTELRVENCNK